MEKCIKIKKILPFILATSFSLITIIGCSNPNNNDSENKLTRVTSDDEKIADFKNGNSDLFYASNGYSNNFPFNCKWKNDAISFSNGQMNMSLYKENDYYVGSEYRSKNKYSYGFYSTMMKPIKCSGVISSFFTYTNNPWDEIDIEFLGKDTTKVQFNYYTSGVGGHEYLYDLGFDASLDFHEYGFLWTDEFIAWFVDGKEVYRAQDNLPVTSTNIMMNVWTGTGDSFNEWCGSFNENLLPQTASYKRIGYSNKI